MTSEYDVLLALRDHFNPKEYVVLPQVRNGAGFSSTRTADALVMSTWPSRGLNLYGIEIKVSRGDWLREQKDPEKADEVAGFCDYWCLAVSHDSIALESEVPAPWGLLVPGKKPGTLRMQRQPKKLKAKPVSRGFLAMILRKTLETVVPLSEVDAEIQRRVDEKVAALEGLMRARLAKEFDPKGTMEDNEKMLAAARAFHEITGCWLTAGDVERYRKVARTLKLLEWAGLDQWLDDLDSAVQRVTGDLERLKAALPKAANAKAVG